MVISEKFDWRANVYFYGKGDFWHQNQIQLHRIKRTNLPHLWSAFTFYNKIISSDICSSSCLKYVKTTSVAVLYDILALNNLEIMVLETFASSQCRSLQKIFMRTDELYLVLSMNHDDSRYEV